MKNGCMCWMISICRSPLRQEQQAQDQVPHPKSQSQTISVKAGKLTTIRIQGFFILCHQAFMYSIHTESATMLMILLKYSMTLHFETSRLVIQMSGGLGFSNKRFSSSLHCYSLCCIAVYDSIIIQITSAMYLDLYC